MREKLIPRVELLSTDVADESGSERLPFGSRKRLKAIIRIAGFERAIYQDFSAVPAFDEDNSF